MLDVLSRWPSLTGIVVGDFMLDELVYGDAERLSADAPVPVLRARRTVASPGGASNLCRDLAALDCGVIALGVTGQDSEGDRLRGLLADCGVEADHLIADESRPTTVKRNLVGLAQHRHPQKMFRVDFESTEAVSAEIAERLLRALNEVLDRADFVCLEDYNKGVCSEVICGAVIKIASDKGLPVFVDPASLDDYSKYRGATAITPNRTEAERATGLSCGDDPAEAARLAVAIQEVTDAEAVVLTLDRHGAMLLERTGDPVVVPTDAREVYDVTGAGDMFLGALATGRGAGMAWEDAVRFANAGAGLEVELFGAQPIPLDRIRRELLRRSGRLSGKLRTQEELLAEVEAARGRGKKVAFTNGCFDILHSGHVKLIERCAALGEYVVIGLNDDASVRRLKGDGRPVNPQEDRARVLGALEGVSSVVLFSEDTPIDLIRAVKPDVLVKGADYSKAEVVGASEVEAGGGRVVLIELEAGKSTTGTIAKLAGG